MHFEGQNYSIQICRFSKVLLSFDAYFCALLANCQSLFHPLMCLSALEIKRQQQVEIENGFTSGCEKAIDANGWHD